MPESADLFAAYEPSAAEPWDVKRVNHLLRRLGFGADADAIDAYLKLSPKDAIDKLFDFDPNVDPFAGLIDQLEGFVRMNDASQVAQWWIFRMINTPHPLQEKIALFWHNHFATAVPKVYNARFMFDQVELFRRKGLGSFRELLVAVGRDPAMLIWLDGKDSRKGKPNENYGREVMELFTLGVGHYSEQDVKELARAFTGWRLEGDKAFFNPKQFDEGEKQILGEKGKFDSESAVDLLLRQAAAPRWIATKLLREFLQPEPTEEQISHYAKRLIDNEWSISATLKELVSSALFVSDAVYRSKIKSPAELCVGAVRAIDGGNGRVNTQFVYEHMVRMGQQLLSPPTVKGWPGDKTWINASTTMLRFNFGQRLASQRDQDFTRRTGFVDWLKKNNISDASSLVDYYAKVLLDGDLAQSTRDRLLEYANLDEKANVRKFDLTERNVETKGKGLLHLMMSMPEYQLA
jgi:hypothetical protein